MHPAEIQAVLKMRGHTQTSVAAMCSVSKASVGEVIKGASRSQRIEACIATLTQLSLGTLWPQWYPPEEGATRPAASFSPLATDEIELLQDYRDLSRQQRDQARAMVKVLKAGSASALGGQTSIETGRTVIATGNSVATGGGAHLHIHGEPRKRK